MADFRRESQCVRALLLRSPQLDIYGIKTLFQGGFTYLPNLSASSTVTSHLAEDWSTAGRGRNTSSLLIVAYKPFFRLFQTEGV